MLAVIYGKLILQSIVSRANLIVIVNLAQQLGGRMSEFSEALAQCMRDKALPAPNVETAREVLEFLDKLHSAWENAGSSETLTVGELIASGALAGASEDAMLVLGLAAGAAVQVYITACLFCLASGAIGALKDLLARGELPDFVVAELDKQGIDMANA